MQNIWSKLQSPRALIIFEAAARLGSFTKAAEELNLQQPSVSAAIKQLEQLLQVQLFYRAHKKVMLTTVGERLFAGISRSLTELEASLRAVQEMGQANHVTLNSSSAFSFYWMMPKLTALRDAHPTIDLRLQNSDREPDLDAENISLGIRIGYGTWDDCESAKLADEVIYPVASPIVMASARHLRSLPSLMHQRLIHLEEPIRERPTWSQWFAHHDIAGRQFEGGLRLNDYTLVLQAAISGEGFAFGWHHVVKDLVSQGVLAARQDWAWHTGRAVYLVWSKKRPLSPQAEAVRRFILEQADD